MGVWIWDLEKKEVLHQLKLYKTKIQAAAFSPSSKYLATLGGDDDNKLVIWDVETGDAICGSPAANDTAYCLAYSNYDDNIFVTAGKYNFRVWQVGFHKNFFFSFFFHMVFLFAMQIEVVNHLVV